MFTLSIFGGEAHANEIVGWMVHSAACRSSSDGWLDVGSVHGKYPRKRDRSEWRSCHSSEGSAGKPSDPYCGDDHDGRRGWLPLSEFGPRFLPDFGRSVGLFDSANDSHA